MLTGATLNHYHYYVQKFKLPRLWDASRRRWERVRNTEVGRRTGDMLAARNIRSSLDRTVEHQRYTRGWIVNPKTTPYEKGLVCEVQGDGDTTNGKLRRGAV